MCKNKILFFFNNFTFNKAIATSISLHLSAVILVMIFNYKPKAYKPFTAIQVAIIADSKDLPTITKKDSLEAVPEAFGAKEEDLKLKKDLQLPPKDKLVFSPNYKKSDTINRLKRLQELRKKSESASKLAKGDESHKGSPTGIDGIKGTTVAQANPSGIQNWYLQRMQEKIHSIFFLPPGFAGGDKSIRTSIFIQLTHEGSLKTINVSKPSGNKIFDDLVLGFVKESSPFGNVPEEYRKIFLEDGFEIRFSPADISN